MSPLFSVLTHFLIFFVFFRASNNQIKDEENWTEFFFKAFKSETRFHTNPGLS